MKAMNIYITYDGNCEEAFWFYRSVLGGEYASQMRFSELPPSEEMPPVPEEHQNRIMHMSLPITENHVLMGSDIAGEWAANYNYGTNFSVSLDTSSKEEADRIFSGLSVDGIVTMPMSDTFWGSYFGSFQDKFGINWMISYDANAPG
jgi:PhnB protein